jgi:arylsulfatase A-like enzyme
MVHRSLTKYATHTIIFTNLKRMTDNRYMTAVNALALIRLWLPPFLTMIAGAAVLIACDSPMPQLPALAGTADTYTMASGMTLRRAAPGVLANDSAVNKNVSTRLATRPSYGTVSLEADGAFLYKPNWRFTGYDAFSYEILDGEEVSAPVLVRISQPNVIVVVVDDVGQGDIGVYAKQADTDTPNLDALAKAGITFNHAHSAAAVCSPSRYSILTGNYPYRGRLAAGVWNPYNPATMIIPGQTTLGNIFSESGYNTAFIGKLHNGGAFWNQAGNNYTRDYKEIDFARKFDRGPTQFGFQYSFVLPSGNSGPPYAYFENDRLVRFDPDSGEYKHFANNQDALKHLVFMRQYGEKLNGGELGGPGFAVDNFDSRQIGRILTRKVLEFLDQAISDNTSAYPPKPFFLFFAPPQIHSPYTPPDFFDIAHSNDAVPVTTGMRVAGTGANQRIDMIRETDLMIGALIDFLKAQNQLENTLIIFTSDNGPVTWPAVEGRYPPGAENGIRLRSLKGEIYEGGHRVPLLARWGDNGAAHSNIPPDIRSNELLGLNDLAATFYALLGKQRLPGQSNDSKNFLPVLLEQQPAGTRLREQLIIQGSPPSAKGPDLIDRAFYKHDAKGDLWKLTVISSSTDPLANLEWQELYNLSTDPAETTDLFGATEQQELLQVMQAEYRILLGQPQTIVSWK